MKSVFIISFLISYATGLFAQNSAGDTESLRPARTVKPPIDTSTFSKWLSIRPTWVDARVTISHDGNYVFYKIREGWRLPSTLIVQATNRDWKMEFADVEIAAFTEDSRSVVFIQSGDSLCLLMLGSSSKEYIPYVGSFKLFKQEKAEWLACQLNTPGKDLMLRNLKTGKEQFFTGVSEYLLGSNGNILVLKTELKQDSIIKQLLSWVILPNGRKKVIWNGKNASNLVLDEGGLQLAFRAEDQLNGETRISFWHYREGAEGAVQIANNQSAGIEKELELNSISKFSKDGSKLFIYLSKKNILKPKPDAVKVDVWSYTDAKLQSQQLNSLRWSPNFAAVIDITGLRIIRLQRENDLAVNLDNDDFLLVINRRGDDMEAHWNAAAESISYLVSTSSGERKALKVNIERYQTLSPNGKYLVGLDADWRDFNCYEIETGATRNLTQAIPVPVLAMIERDDMDRPLYRNNRGLEFLGWVDNGDALINDEYDIWQIDPAGRKTPVNLTGRHGRKNKIVLRLAGIYCGKTIPGNGELLLTAFDKTNKNSGFYKIVLNKSKQPQLLTMGPHQYDKGYNCGTQTKARDAEVYIVMRESAVESPNYFRTNDFKTFTQLSSVHPEKKYNWLTSELVKFGTLDGRTEDAVLYKPEDFDSTKKYPVIIHYYERKSQDLNKYYKPAETNGELDIAWFVSHGYLVFTPDIHFRMGETGQSACNSVIAAAKFLSRYDWVDTKRIGIQGHSHGGYETNYIVTQSNLFAAAVSSSGSSNLVSAYGQLIGDRSKQYFPEIWQSRLGVSLWEKPDLYIKNSPIFYVDKITTPILTVANKRDVNVRFEQGLEWFIALRRLGKKAWMLQYDEGSHGLDGKDYKDYVIRMTQFFDHYLKGAPAPKWMTRGVPAGMKGIDDGLELDYEIQAPGPGLLISEPKTH